MNKQIIIAECVTEDQIGLEEASPLSEVDVDSFVRSPECQLDMPTALAEAINLSIAFLNALEKDFAADFGSVNIQPWTDRHGDLQTTIRVSGFTRPESYGPLSVYESMLMVAYMTVLGIQRPVSFPEAVSEYLSDDCTIHKVVITYNNDDSGEIIDKTQAKLLIRFNSRTAYPWEISLHGSYDIETDTYRSADGETVLAIGGADDVSK